MAEVTAKSTVYMNPLTLEAQLFLNTMQTYGKKCTQLDTNLYLTLENVITAVEEFMSQTFTPIVPTKNTKLLPPQEANSIVRIYHCDVCKMDLGKKAEQATMHLINGHRHNNKNAQKARNEARESAKKANKENNAVARKMPKKTTAMFKTMDFTKFFNDSMMIAEKLKTIPEYDVIEKELLDLIQPAFPEQKIKIYKFGSRISGIGTRNSDLDMFVDIGKTFNKFENTASAMTLKNLNTVNDILKKNEKSWAHLRCINSARVPIIRARNVKTDIDCDIGFSNSLGHCNTRLVEYLFELQPIARRMCIFLKKWLERSKLNDQITSYTMILMVIYHLQIQKHLPSIELLQFGLEPKLNIGPWIGNFIEKKMNDLNMKRLDVSIVSCQRKLNEFFNFYANFEFDKLVVCPFFGRPMRIAHIKAELPQRYATYVQTADAGGKEIGLEINKPMIVQDPIQLNHNVSKAIKPAILAHIVDYFRLSQEALQALL